MLIILLILFVVILPFDSMNLSIIYCDNNCSEVVVWGSNLSSTVKYPTFSKLISSTIVLTPYIKGALVGLILGDMWIQKRKPTWNARLGFERSMIHFDYFWRVFILLSHYCGSFPYFRHHVRKGISSYDIAFQTRALPCFTELYHIFYFNGVKIIPSNIFELLTPTALAHWICCDGSAKPGGLELCTDSYTIPEVVLLINVLIIKYRFDCTLRFHSGKYPRIYIPTKSMAILRSIVLPYMDPSMLYKLYT